MANLQILNCISDGILKKLDVQHHVIMIHIKLKDIHPHIFLLNFKFLTKNYILDILMIYSKVLLSAKFIVCDSHWK